MGNAWPRCSAQGGRPFRIWNGSQILNACKWRKCSEVASGSPHSTLIHTLTPTLNTTTPAVSLNTHGNTSLTVFEPDTVIDVLTSMTVSTEDRHREIVSMTVCEKHRHRKSRDDGVLHTPSSTMHKRPFARAPRPNPWLTQPQPRSRPNPFGAVSATPPSIAKRRSCVGVRCCARARALC